MPNSFHIEIDTSDLKESLDQIRDRCGNLRPAMLAIGNIMQNSIRANFDAGGRPEKWKPLSQATILGMLTSRDLDKRKKTATLKSGSKKRIGSKKRLIGLGMRGGLMGSIHFSADKSSVEVGPDDRPYARIQQFGGQAGRGLKVTIPASPYLLVQDQDKDNAKQTILSYLMED